MKQGNTTNDLLYNREGNSNSANTNTRSTTISSSQQPGQSSGQLTMSQLLEPSSSQTSKSGSSNHHLGPSWRPGGTQTHLLSTIPPQTGPSSSAKTNIENNMQYSNTGDGSSTFTKGTSAQLSMPSSSGAATSLNQSEIARELEDAKDKLKIMTTKFATTRKERDQLKTENKEL